MRHSTIALVLALVIASASLPCQDIIMSVSGSGLQTQFGQGVAPLRDYDADGYPDFVASGVDRSFALKGPYVGVVSGGTSQVLAMFSGFGVTLATTGTLMNTNVIRAGDLNGDGVLDLLVSAWEEPDVVVVPTLAGNVYALSGYDGALLYSMQGTFVGDDFGKSLADIGDLNGDGVSDFAIGTPQISAPLAGGYFQVRSGASGAILFSVTDPSPSSTLGYEIVPLGDTNGDGVIDFAVSNPRTGINAGALVGEVRIYSGTGTLLRTLTAGQPGPPDLFGTGLANLGDIDNDAVADLGILLSAGIQPVVRCVSGYSGATLWTSTVGQVRAHIRMGAEGVSDQDGDGVRDMLVTDARGLSGISQTQSQAILVSGATGNLIKVLTSMPTVAWNNTTHPPHQVAADIGDLTGDGIPDFALGVAPSEGNTFGLVNVMATLPATLLASSISIQYASSIPILGIPLPRLGALIAGTIQQAQPNAPGFLVVSPGSEYPFPYLGATVYPNINFASSWQFLPVATSPLGSAYFPIQVPYVHSMAGTVLTVQAYVPSMGGPQASLSNGVRLTIGY